MKKSLLIIAYVLSIVSCSKQPIENETEPKVEYIEVSIKQTGDYIVEKLNKAGTTTDLIGIEILDDSYYYYATGVFDDPSEIRIKLAKGCTYHVVYYIMKDGQNIVRSGGDYDIPYAYPFTIINHNGGGYKWDLNVNEFLFGGDFAQKPGHYCIHKDGTGHYDDTFELYAGIETTTISDLTSELVVDVHRMAWGITVNWTNAPEGKLYYKNQSDERIELTNGKTLELALDIFNVQEWVTTGTCKYYKSFYLEWDSGTETTVIGHYSPNIYCMDNIVINMDIAKALEGDTVIKANYIESDWNDIEVD